MEQPPQCFPSGGLRRHQRNHKKAQPEIELEVTEEGLQDLWALKLIQEMRIAEAERVVNPSSALWILLNGPPVEWWDYCMSRLKEKNLITERAHKGVDALYNMPEPLFSFVWNMRESATVDFLFDFSDEWDLRWLSEDDEDFDHLYDKGLPLAHGEDSRGVCPWDWQLEKKAERFLRHEAVVSMPMSFSAPFLRNNSVGSCTEIKCISAECSESWSLGDHISPLGYKWACVKDSCTTGLLRATPVTAPAGAVCFNGLSLSRFYPVTTFTSCDVRTVVEVSKDD